MSRKKPKAAEPAAVWVDIDALKPWDRNPRVNDHAVDRVAESIKRFGFGAPILARRADGEIIAGHTRLKAARKLGLERVPVRYLDLDPADAHVLALADNQLGTLSSWDEPALGKLLGELRAEDDALLAASGFNDQDLAALLRDDGGAAEVVGAGPSLTDRFVIPPFSALDGRAGYWQERKRAWLTMVGSLSIRAGRTFAAGRKLGTTHQHVLVFVKGDPRRATEACGPVDVELGDPMLEDGAGAT